MTSDVEEYQARLRAEKPRVTSALAVGDVRVTRLEGGGIGAVFDFEFTGPAPRLDRLLLTRLVRGLVALGDLGDDRGPTA